MTIKRYKNGNLYGRYFYRNKIVKIWSIYSILNKITNQIYIGQSNNVNRRLSSHKSLLKKNKHHNKHLLNSYNKYGVDSFTFNIIETNIHDPFIADDRERFYIKKFNSMNQLFGFNRESGGNDKKEVSEDSRRKKSESMKGEKHPYYGKFGLEHPRTGHKHTEEWKKNHSKNRIGHYTSRETKKLISKANSGSKNGQAKVVIDTKTGIEYGTIQEAAKSVGFSVVHLSRFLNNKRKNNTNLRFKSNLKEMGNKICL